MKTEMSSVREHASRIPAPPINLPPRTEAGRRPRPALLLAIVWVVVGAGLYTAEIFRLAGLG